MHINLMEHGALLVEDLCAFSKLCNIFSWKCLASSTHAQYSKNSICGTWEIMRSNYMIL